MFEYLRLLFLVLALVVLPSCYGLLCLRMRRSEVPCAPYLPFFFIFGTVGGWCLGLAFSPSGLTALSLVFLVTLAPLSLVASAVWLWRHRLLSQYHRAALYSSFGYLGFVALWLSLVIILAGPTR